jgi:hypothetical protein
VSYAQQLVAAGRAAVQASIAAVAESVQTAGGRVGSSIFNAGITYTRARAHTHTHI